MNVEAEIGALRASLRTLRQELEKHEQRLLELERRADTHENRITGLWRDLVHKPTKTKASAPDGEATPLTRRDLKIAIGVLAAVAAGLRFVVWVLERR